MSTATTTADTTTPHRVDAATLSSWLERPVAVTILDVRSPGEFEALHIAGSCNVPLQMLDRHATSFAAHLAHHDDRPVVLVCQTGVRATQARHRLAVVGLENLNGNLRVLDGGVLSFAAGGGDVVRGPGRWAMDRQVRLVAGSLVLASTLASLALPRARFLAAGIGAGLTCSALSDNCALATVLGRLPYNRGPKNPDVAQVIAQLPPPSPSQDDAQHTALDSRA